MHCMPAFSIALNVYTLGGSAVSIIDKAREFCNYQDNQMEAMEVWNSNVDGAYDLPDLMTLNAEERSSPARLSWTIPPGNSIWMILIPWV